MVNTMKKIIVTSLIAIFLMSILSGCNGVRREDVGLIGGGVAGGALGSAVTGGSTAGTIVGAVGGAFAGRAIARRTR